MPAAADLDRRCRRGLSTHLAVCSWRSARACAVGAVSPLIRTPAGLPCQPATRRPRGAASRSKRTIRGSRSGPISCAAGWRAARAKRRCRMITSPKIEPRHLRLRALVYVRQSTPQQLQHNQESTRRQYQLAERAQQMGWPAAQVLVIDDDLGLSGTSSDQRGGFQRLVASIGLGEVGIVLVTEVSRLSRCNSDWHRVIELCAVFATLIADEDGVYDPRDPNDRLLLGVKGTLFAAELHILQARMRGGLINKAQRGALAVTLPIGFRRTAKGGVMLDPDEAVRLAIAAVFERFGVLRNARAVQRHFLTNGLKLPRLIQSGPEAGQIVWVRPSYQMLHRMLVNPAYASTFVFGRTKREVMPGDPPAVVDRRLGPGGWERGV